MSYTPNWLAAFAPKIQHATRLATTATAATNAYEMELSLDPVQRPLKNSETTLAEQIVRITQERGSFQQITEENLQDEISNLNSPEEKPSEEDHFEQERIKLSGKIKNALNESALSLDFVSLLVSGLRPQAGVSSMSPMLKTQVPPGTLNADTVAPSSMMPSLAQVKGNPCPGWKLAALDDAAEMLERAITNLETEVNREETFWQQVSATINRGESIHKVKKQLVCNYGYADSGSKYPVTTGRGTIEKGDDGSMVFTSTPPSGRAVVVTVHRHDQVHSRAYMACDATTEIAIARHYLFEDELFYYLMDEARLDSSNFRVLLNEGAIVCQLYEYTIEITSVLESEITVVGGLAQTLCDLLHLLLQARHDANLRAAHETPLPLGTPHTAPQTQLLRPVLAHIQQAETESRALNLIKMMVPEASIEKQPQPQPARVIDMLLKCAPSTYKIVSKSTTVTLTINADPERKTFEAEAGDKSCQFYDLAELELWLRYII